MFAPRQPDTPPGDTLPLLPVIGSWVLFQYIRGWWLVAVGGGGRPGQLEDPAYAPHP